MDKRITYRGIEKTPALESLIEKHYAPIAKFLEKEHGPMHIEITLEVHKPAEQKATVHINGPRIEVYVSETSNDIFSSIKRAFEIAHEKMLEDKRRAIDKQKQGCGHECKSRLFSQEEKELEAEIDEEERQ
ncbi:MAG: hypothetical protein UU47_C0002G0020 [candidate division TM6 bacterium GW2011_GWE2_41_16]|nr:MAG: hypothetical protein UU47_C0002G0020 [candidate division TM6 bacterium GW2011_GWE2_41_16]